ncbi:hypothetical protein DFH27DRAFT_528784 [Peziza echinospora]|nr:hypothetical protein DFH27DRAFT_528784 [Peziza echinospora]
MGGKGTPYRPGSRLRHATQKQREAFSTPYSHRKTQVPHIPTGPRQFAHNSSYLNDAYYPNSSRSRDDRGRVRERDWDRQETRRRRRSSRSISPEYRGRYPKKEYFMDYERPGHEYSTYSDSESNSEAGDWEDLDLSSEFDEPEYYGPGYDRPRLRLEEAAYLRRMLLKFRAQKRYRRVRVVHNRVSSFPSLRHREEFHPYKRSSSFDDRSYAPSSRSAGPRKSFSNSRDARDFDTDDNNSLHTPRHSSFHETRPTSRKWNKPEEGPNHFSGSVPTGPRFPRGKPQVAPVPTGLREAINVRSHYKRAQGPTLHVRRWLSDRYAKPTKFFFGQIPKSEGILPSYKQDPNDSNKFLNVPRPALPQRQGKVDSYRGKAYPDWLKSRKNWLEENNLSYPDHWKPENDSNKDVAMSDATANNTPSAIRHQGRMTPERALSTEAWRDAITIDAESVCENGDDMATEMDAQSEFAMNDNDSVVDFMTRQLAASTPYVNEWLIFEPTNENQHNLPTIVQTQAESPRHSLLDAVDEEMVTEIAETHLAPVVPENQENAPLDTNPQIVVTAPGPEVMVHLTVPQPQIPLDQLPQASVVEASVVEVAASGDTSATLEDTSATSGDTSADVQITSVTTSTSAPELQQEPQLTAFLSDSINSAIPGLGLLAHLEQLDETRIQDQGEKVAYSISQADWDDEWEKEWKYTI